MIASLSLIAGSVKLTCMALIDSTTYLAFRHFITSLSIILSSSWCHPQHNNAFSTGSAAIKLFVLFLFNYFFTNWASMQAAMIHHA
jgi:hypothetical protein